MPFYDYPVVALNSLTIDGRSISPYVQGSGSIGYLFDIKTLYLKNGVFEKGIQNIAINYDAGYQTIPYEIEQVTIDLIALKYKQRERIGLLSVHMGTETTTYSRTDLTDDAKKLLQQYQRVAPI
jgi:aspartate aminotransferase-like enzyme